MTRPHRISYLKTSLLALTAGLVILAAGLLLASVSGSAHVVMIVVLACVAAAVPLSVAVGGAVVLYRDQRQARGGVDIFRAAAAPRAEAAIEQGGFDFGLACRRLLRAIVGGRQLLVGDVVRVRSYDEIRATLDERGTLDGLPFLPEMRRYCGQRGRVFRCVDKIYDYGRTKQLRRLKDSYLLTHLRCDGSAHGGCQAGCPTMWKQAWLERVTVAEAAQPVAAVADGVPSGMAVGQSGQPATYTCQFTELAAASTPMSIWQVRPDLRPLWAGNITLRGFCIALLTRWFNYVQHLRGGTGYPAQVRTSLTSTPTVTHGLADGDMVRVNSAEAISLTLDKTGRNRGLWFDRDMIKHCGKTYHVLKRVDRIIDDATGNMRVMKSPCIVLRDVNYSGEFLRFCAQEEYLYWREAWLEPLRAGSKVSGTGSDAAVELSQASS